MSLVSVGCSVPEGMYTGFTTRLVEMVDLCENSACPQPGTNSMKGFMLL